MFDYSVSFDRPGYLVLLALLPLLWWFSFRSLAGLGPVRRLLALVLRTIVMVALVLALAEMQWVRISQRLTVIYLLDQSESIPVEQRQAMIDFARRDVKQHRDKNRQDRAGVIVFGGDAVIEIPPFDDDLQLVKIESRVDTEHTNLAAAMKLAQASFPEDAAKRIVIVSDGNQNLGDAVEQARVLADAGIGIDVVPVRYAARSEVAVERIALPSDVRRGQPFDVRIVLNNTAPSGVPGDGSVAGRLKIVRKAGGRETVLQDQDVTLPPGKTVLTFREEIDSPDFYTYEARFTPNDPTQDTTQQNNRATTFTHVRGRGQVLLIEDFESRGEHDLLVERLKAENLEVAVRASAADQLFGSLPELQPYDAVILANVPREHFTDAQIRALVRNTQQMGSGLIMLGGPNSFGAGGWTNTEIEAAMPVDFTVKAAKVSAVGALAMLMHASEMEQGNYWQKVIGLEAIKALGSYDYCGLLHFDGTDQWLWKADGRGLVRVGPNRERMLALLGRMQPGDMPAFDPAMRMAAAEFANLPDAAVKHMIIISDGDPSPPTQGTLQQFIQMGVKISTVAIGAHGPAESAALEKIATATGGKYYRVTDPKALPRIYQKEARRVARPLVYEREAGFQPRVVVQHEMVQRVGDVLPPITGFVLTHRKENSLVEVPIISPVPATDEDNPILAGWPYGLGKAVAFTTDDGKRWANAWTNWENYGKFFSQIVRWAMRPVGEQGKFNVATEVRDGKVRAVITALDNNDEFLNFLQIEGTAVGPNLEPIDVRVQQIAPGRYVGEFDTAEAGSYFLLLNPGGGLTPIRAGVDVPYSAEFTDRETDEGLLSTLAGVLPKGGAAGLVIDEAPADKPLATDTFRHDLAKARSGQDVWNLLVLFGACLFFFDVFFRRVAISLAWVPQSAAWVRDKLLRRQHAGPTEQYIERLRSRKAAVADQLEQQRAAARFEPQPDEPVDTEILEEEPKASAPPEPPKPTTPLAPEGEADDYTSRLLKAKKKVWDEKDKDKND